MTSFEVFTTHQCMPLERRDEAEELGVRWRAVVWRLCGGVRGRAAWRVRSAVPGVVRKADIQFNPPRGSYLVVSGVSVDFPPDGQSQTKAVTVHRGKVNSNRGYVRHAEQNSRPAHRPGTSAGLEHERPGSRAT